MGNWLNQQTVCYENMRSLDPQTPYKSACNPVLGRCRQELLANGLVKGFSETLSQNIIWKVTKINLILTIHGDRTEWGEASIQQPCSIDGGNRHWCRRVRKQAKEQRRDLKVEGYAREEATRLNFHTALLTLSASSLYLFLSPMHMFSIPTVKNVSSSAICQASLGSSSGCRRQEYR